MKRFFTLRIILMLMVLTTAGLPMQAQTGTKSTTGGIATFTVRTVPFGGNFAPKHVLAIWVEDADGFVKTRKAMAQQRKQYLYTWHAASNYNVVDAITGPTLTSHQTHTVSWNCKDLDGNLVPDGEYTFWVEFTDKHAQGPLYTLSFTKGPEGIVMTPPDETYFKDLEFEFTPWVAEFSADATEICQWGTVTFTDESVNATSWEWDFGEGAAPATSSTQGPHTVYYTTPGVKTVTLTINGEVTETKTAYITVNTKPEAGFTWSAAGTTVTFSNSSIDATGYEWDFGDGTTSEEENPVHTYASSGDYTVTLTALNGPCADTYSEVCAVITGLSAYSPAEEVSVSPNPAGNHVRIDWSAMNVKSSGWLNIFDLSGKRWASYQLTEGVSSYNADLGRLPEGVYLISLRFDDQNIVRRLVHTAGK